MEKQMVDVQSKPNKLKQMKPKRHDQKRGKQIHQEKCENLRIPGEQMN